jgi:hypothetical protein
MGSDQMYHNWMQTDTEGMTRNNDPEYQVCIPKCNARHCRSVMQLISSLPGMCGEGLWRCRGGAAR